MINSQFLINDQFPISNDQTLGIGFWGFIERWALGFGVLLSLIVSGSVIVHRGAIAMGAKEEREGTVYMAGLEAAVSDSVVRRSGAGRRRHGRMRPDPPKSWWRWWIRAWISIIPISRAISGAIPTRCQATALTTTATATWMTSTGGILSAPPPIRGRSLTNHIRKRDKFTAPWWRAGWRRAGITAPASRAYPGARRLCPCGY